MTPSVSVQSGKEQAGSQQVELPVFETALAAISDDDDAAEPCACTSQSGSRGDADA